jgi:hypothetical protein
MIDDQQDPPRLTVVPDEEPENAPARIDQSPGPYPHVSKHEALRRRQALTKLLFSYVPITAIHDHMRASFGMTDRAIEELERQICEDWAKEDQRRRPFLKAIRVRQLERSIAEAVQAGAWPSVMKGSEQLSKMEGTLAPLAVDVHATGQVQHTHAFAKLLGEMPQDELRALIEAERRRLGDSSGEPIEVEVAAVAPPEGPD